LQHSRHGICCLPQMPESVTYVSGMTCYLCVGTVSSETSAGVRRGSKIPRKIGLFVRLRSKWILYSQTNLGVVLGVPDVFPIARYPHNLSSRKK
jgi:hypothetical protein